jgi:hypothetical protein
VGQSVPEIGEPDLTNQQHSTEKLAAMFPKPLQADLLVGVTGAILQGNYFTRTSGVDVVIVTAHHTAELCDPAHLTFEEYVVQSIATELMWLLYKRERRGAEFMEVFHPETRSCLLDRAEKKIEKVRKLRSGALEKSCRDKLRNAGVPKDLLRAAERVVRYVQRPPVSRTFRESIERPLFSLLVGSVIGGLLINLLSSLVLGDFDSRSDGVVLVALVVVLVALVMVNHIRYRSSRGHS